VLVPDLGDRGHVDRKVEAPVAAPRQPADLPVPDDTSAGAVPLQAATWSRPGNRDTCRMPPITMPAITGPTPKTLL
jgi:hypothetical protein